MMSPRFSARRRITETVYCLTLAAAGCAAIVIQGYLGIGAAVSNGVTPPIAVLNFFSYFTILTNLLTALTLLAALSGRPRGLTTVGAQTAVCSYILVVGFVYEAALRSLWQPQGLHLAVDTTLHDVVPLGFFGYWLLFVPKGALSWRSLPSWAVYPALYALYCLARGLADGFFPYPFVDFQQHGWRGWGWNVLLLVGLFMGTGALLVALDKVLARRTRFSRA